MEWLFGLYFLSLAFGTMLEQGTLVNLAFLGIFIFLELLDRDYTWKIQGIMVIYVLLWLSSLVATFFAPVFFGIHNFTISGIAALFTTGIFTVINTWIILRRCKGERIINLLKMMTIPILFFGVIEYIKQDLPFREILSLQDPFRLEWVTQNYRVRTIFWHPIIYAVFLTFMWAFVLYYPYKHRMVDIIMKGLILFNIYVTMSRSSWIAVILVTIIYLAIKCKDCIMKRKKEMTFYVNKWIVGTGIILGLAITMVAAREWIMEQGVIIEQRMAGVLETDIDKSAGAVRLLNMKNIWNSYLENTSVFAGVFGRGSKASLQYMEEHPAYGWTEAVDNQYVATLWNNGILGVILLGGMIVYSFSALWGTSPKMPQDKLRKAAALSSCAFFLSAFFYEGLENKVTVLLFTISCILMMKKDAAQIF